MRRKIAVWLTLLMLVLACACSPEVEEQLKLEFAASAVTLSDGASFDGQLTMVIGDTETVSLALPIPDVTVTAAVPGGKATAAVEGTTIKVTAVAEGTDALQVTLTAPDGQTLQHSIPLTVKLRTQELSAKLLPVADGEAPSTAVYADSKITLQQGSTATLELVGEPDTTYSLGGEVGAAMMTLQDNLLTFTAVELGTMTVVVTGEKQDYQPTTIEIAVEVLLPDIKVELTAKDIDPLSPAIDTGSSVKITVATQPAEAVLTVSSDNEAVVATLAKQVLTITGKASGKATVTLTATCEGYADTTQTIAVESLAGRVPLTLSSKSMGSNSTIKLVKGDTAQVTATTAANAKVAYELKDNKVVEITRDNNTFSVKAVGEGTVQVAFAATAEGVPTNRKTVTFVVEKVQPKPQVATISVRPSSVEVELAEGEEYKDVEIKVTATPADADVSYTTGGKVEVVSDSPTGATLRVSGTGTVTAHVTKSGYTAAEATVSVRVKTAKAPESKDISTFADEVFRLVNEERAKAGLSPFSRLSDVEDAANTRAREIKSKFSHTRPNGGSFYTVLGIAEGMNYYYGENIAYGQSTPAAVMKSWMASPGHRSNILDSSYTGIGIGVYQSGSVYWVQIFQNDTEYTPEEDVADEAPPPPEDVPDPSPEDVPDPQPDADTDTAGEVTP